MMPKVTGNNESGDAKKFCSNLLMQLKHKSCEITKITMEYQQSLQTFSIV